MRLGGEISRGSFTSSACVRSVLLGIPKLHTPFQTELAIDTNMVVSDTQVAVADIQTVVADIHRNVLAGQEGTSGQNNSVGAT